MRVSRALVLFTHLIALVGFVSLLLTGQVGALTALFFTAAIAFSFYNEINKAGYYISTALSTVFALVLVVYVISDVLLLGSELLAGILNFLIFTQIIKLLGRKQSRDIVQIYVLSFFQFLAGSVLTVNFNYALAFVLYVAVFTWAIIVFTINNEAREAGHTDRNEPKVVTPLFLSTTVLISFCIFVFSALIFVSVPRLRSGVFATNFLRAEALRSGFSDSVNLGSVGEIKLDGSPVMSVKFINRNGEDLDPAALYWRGIALDHFDGKSWNIRNSGYEFHQFGKDGVIRPVETNSLLSEQEIVTQQLDTDVLFAANTPYAFKHVPGGRIAEANDSYMLAMGLATRIKYTAYSDLDTPAPDDLRHTPNQYPKEISSKYLDLPEMSNEVNTLVDSITANDVTPYDKAVSIKRHLLTNYKYTRTLEGTEGIYPLEDFLFRVKEGHCEYFASAMVVMLREAGVPARLVNGFLGAEWNRLGEFFLVRESNAHSWAEAYFPGHGWVIFDATPEGLAIGERGEQGYMAAYLDYLRYRWNRYIVDFSQRDQIRIFSGVKDNIGWQKKKLSTSAIGDLKRHKKWLFVIALLIAGAWFVINRPELSGLLPRGGNRAKNRATAMYMRALKFSAKKGYEKPINMTPTEFSNYLVKEGGEQLSSIYPLTKQYLDMRFGESYDEGELSVLAEMLRSFQRDIRKAAAKV